MFRTAASALVLLAAAPFAQAQGEGRLETVIVSASRVDEEDDTKRPAVTLRLPADHVLFEMSLSTGSLELAERRGELDRTLQSARRAAERRDDVELFAGSADGLAALETAELDEIVRTYSDRSSIGLIVRIEVAEGDDFPAVRSRFNEFVGAIEESGRAQSEARDEQFLSLDNPGQYRAELLRRIGQDVALLQESFPGQTVSASFEGLHKPIVTHPVGPLELELYIPYEMEISLGETD